MTTTRTLIAAVAIALLAGCATSGNEKMRDQTQASIAAQITEGKTTKEEVRASLGDATSVAFTDSGKEIWTYKHMRASPKAINFIPIVNLFARGADVKTKEVVILFDGNVVSKYTMRETANEVKQGIAQ